MVNFSAMRYIHQVKQCMPSPFRMKKKIMERVKHNVKEYLVENPSANYQNLVDRFGSPNQIAASYVDEQSAAELLSALRIKRKISAIVAAAVIGVVMMWGGVMAYEIYYNANIANSYTIVTIEESEPVEVLEAPWRH